MNLIKTLLILDIKIHKMGTSKDNLIDKIYKLEQQLKEAKKHTYIYESHSLQVWDGELHIGYGDLNDEKSLVWNVESLYKDLPFIITQVIKEQNKTHNMHYDLIVESLKEIKK